MTSDNRTTLRWFVSLGAKFVRVVPWHSLLIVVTTLTSQICMLLAFLLPLKVIMLLGSKGIPHYFPSFLTGVDRDTLIILLSCATAGFYVVYLLAEKVIAVITASAIKRLLVKSQKMVLFESQDEVAGRAYQSYSRTLAGAVFVLLALVLLFVIYPDMAALFVGFVLLAVAVMLAVIKLFPADESGGQLTQMLNLAGGIGFFAVFGYLVADFTAWHPPGMIVTIISILLVRQIIQRIKMLVQDFSRLCGQREKLNALFFHGLVLFQEEIRNDRSIWPLLWRDSRDEWVRPLLEDFTGETAGDLEYRWRQLGVRDIAALEVNDTVRERRYLVKLFDVNRSAAAMHEASLLTDPPSGLPAPALLGATCVRRFHCHLYDWPETRPGRYSGIKNVKNRFRAELFSVEPPETLSHRYQRSRPMLWQRLYRQKIERLFVAANTDKRRDQLERFMESLPTVQDLLKRLPLVIFPDFTPHSLYNPGGEDARPVLLHWGVWSIEPAGAGWPLAPKQLDYLRDLLIEAAETRPELAGVPPEDVQLAALAFAFEKRCNNQRFVEALELLPDMLKRLAPADHGASLAGAAGSR